MVSNFQTLICKFLENNLKLFFACFEFVKSVIRKFRNFKIRKIGKSESRKIGKSSEFRPFSDHPGSICVNLSTTNVNFHYQTLFQKKVMIKSNGLKYFRAQNYLLELIFRITLSSGVAIPECALARNRYAAVPPGLAWESVAVTPFEVLRRSPNSSASIKPSQWLTSRSYGLKSSR